MSYVSASENAVPDRKMHQFLMSNSQFGDPYESYDQMPPMQAPPMSESVMNLLGACGRFSIGYVVPDHVFGSSSSSPTSYGAEALAVSAVTHSRFLKPAQMLLDEVISVGSEAIDVSNKKLMRKLSRTSIRGSFGLRSSLNGNLFAEKHVLYSTLMKLISLLEELEGRYEKYYNELERVVLEFEMVAGFGAGKSYCALALQVMSRRFSYVRDSILSQIQATKKQILREMPRMSADLSELNLLDQDSKQSTNLGLRCIGFIDTSIEAWRPERGLPGSAVKGLRGWLFEHFLHPYPTEVEKRTLAIQLGISKTQVANWFINARVRLWKPMVEAMYQKECAEDDEANSGEGCADSTEDLCKNLE